MISVQYGLCFMLSFLALSQCGETFFHQAPDQFKLSPGWQEPGFWRPKFIMERIFTTPEGDIEKVDRVYFKLKPDRTMKIFKTGGRPFLEIGRKTEKSEEQRKKKMFEAGEKKKSDSAMKEFTDQKVDEAYFAIDGTWWWQDAAPLNQGKVKLETREGKKGGEIVKIRHDVRCDWGELDSYVPKFREGKLLKYKVERGIPVGTETCGTFTIKVSPHRPMVSKDFMAFQ